MSNTLDELSSEQQGTTCPAVIPADAFTSSRLAADLMAKYQDDPVVVVSLGISQALEALGHGAGYAAALAAADDLVLRHRRVMQAVDLEFEGAPDYVRKEARLATLIGIASDECEEKILARARAVSVTMIRPEDLDP